MDRGNIQSTGGNINRQGKTEIDRGKNQSTGGKSIDRGKVT